MKDLSIIIISYNEKKYIGESIESCIQQEGIEDYEIIIGDDGSTDGSIDVIEDYKSRYPQISKTFVMDRTDCGSVVASLRVSNVIKRAIEASEGKYILILSADDLILGSTRCSTQVNYLKNHKDMVACYVNYKKFWSDGTEVIVASKCDYPRGVLWGCHYIHISSFMFKREVANNFLESFCDDTGAMFSIIKTGRVGHNDIMGFGYRQRDKSIMHSSDEMELMILDMLVFQDVLNAKGFILSTYARFSKPLTYVYKHKYLLDDDKYLKYRQIGMSKNNDYLSKIYESKSNELLRIKLVITIFFSKMLRFTYKIRRRICNFIIVKSRFN